jgi:DNA-binding response OmpR family regulator
MLGLLFSYNQEESAVLSFMLQQVGFNVRTVKKLESSFDTWPEEPVEFICIAFEENFQRDITIIKQLRGHTLVPMVAVTNPLIEEHEVALLEAGIDLVFFRPFGTRVFLAKVRALLRRTAGMPFHSLPTMTRGDLILDPGSRTVQVEEKEPKRLTQLEFRLLYTLMTHVGQIIPTESIVEQVWGFSGEGNRELVRGLVQRLRSKVEPDKRNPRYILTEKGLGYFLGND